MPPSLIFQGIALAELTAALMFMVTSKRESRKSAIFRLSCIAWVFVVVATALDIGILDFFVSPYPLPEKFWHPKMVLAGFFVGVCAELTMMALLLVRLNIFYGIKSPVFWLLLLIGFASVCFAIPGNYLAVLANVDVFEGKYAFFTDSPRMTPANALFGAARACEGLFSALSSMSFLWAIGKSLGFSKKGFLYEVMFNHDGVRFLVILGLNITITTFAITAYFRGYDYITYCSWYMTTLIYAIEIRTFLIASYVSTRDIIEKNRIGLTATSPISVSHIRSMSASEEAKRTRFDIELEEQRQGTVRYF
nr:hypothetical protein HK105_004161 [Polyrhizophydium stewartii]